MLGTNERARLDATLLFTPDDRELLRVARDRSRAAGNDVGCIGGVPLRIRQTALGRRDEAIELMVVPDMVLVDDAITPHLSVLRARYGDARVESILRDYRKTHALRLEAAITATRPHRWYSKLLGRPDCDITIRESYHLLDGAILSLPETNTVLRGIRQLGKETDDARRLYNGLDAIAYAALTQRPSPISTGAR